MSEYHYFRSLCWIIAKHKPKHLLIFREALSIFEWRMLKARAEKENTTLEAREDYIQHGDGEGI